MPFCYGDEENARIYAVHLTTANQSEIRRAHLVSVLGFSLLNALHMSFSRRNEYAWNKNPPAMRVETNKLYEKNTFPLQ